MYWQRRYPREDIEPAIMGALYRAAYSYRPGIGTFYHWFIWKAKGAISAIRKRHIRRHARIKARTRSKLGDLPLVSVWHLGEIQRDEFDARHWYT